MLTTVSLLIHFSLFNPICTYLLPDQSKTLHSRCVIRGHNYPMRLAEGFRVEPALIFDVIQLLDLRY
jgi:hypothetical protein